MISGSKPYINRSFRIDYYRPYYADDYMDTAGKAKISIIRDVRRREERLRHHTVRISLQLENLLTLLEQLEHKGLVTYHVYSDGWRAVSKDSSDDMFTVVRVLLEAQNGRDKE